MKSSKTHFIRGGKDDKWRAFSQQLGGNFVRPWLEDIDEDPDDLLLIFSRLFDKEAVTIRGYIEDVVSKKKIHFPFVLDVEKNILIYAFNSASISQTDILLNPADHEIVDRIRTGRKSKDTKILLRILDQQLQIDPARVAPQELFLFDAFMEKIESRIDLTSFYKVAVLHHHISTITALEEVKQFEHVINAGSLKKHLTDRDYQMVMHGHKHYADIFFDSAIENHKKLLVMSGGTVFGYSNGREPGFYLHSLQGNIINSRFIYLDKKRPSDVSLVKLNGDMDIRRGLTMSEIYRNAEYRVVQHINKEVINGQEYWGWSKNIEESKVGVISSAYGLLILGLLRSNEKYYILKREKIINSLWLFRHENGGWGAVSQVNGDGALEATAWIVLAFYMVCSPLYVEALKDLLRILERDDTSINSNFTLCLIINVLCQVMPENEKLPEFCERLLDSAIREAGKIKYWCINCDGNFIRGTEPSIVHTAHAVITLYACQQRGIISRDLETELKGAREILLNRSLWKNTHEAISKQIGAKEDSLVVDYYTVAWVLKALLYMDSFIDSSIIQDAVNRLLNDYQYGYWNYDGCHYIWTLYDAITALKMYLMKR